MHAQRAISETDVGRSRSQSISSSNNQLLALREVPLFQAMPTRHLKRVAALASLSRYRDASVVRAGTRGDALYIILAGTAQVRTSDGYKRLLQAGDSFGELRRRFAGDPERLHLFNVGILFFCTHRTWLPDRQA